MYYSTAVIYQYPITKKYTIVFPTYLQHTQLVMPVPVIMQHEV